MSKPRKVRDVERQERMVSLYREGSTLEKIGQSFGLTRERVRQIIAAAGVTRNDGGMHIASRQRQERRKIVLANRRDRRALAYYGNTYGVVLELNDFRPPSVRGSAAERYKNQRNAAMYRQIPWEMTFEQWLSVWRESGKWEQRGKGRGGYCMARRGDTGPYSVENVYITTCDDNVRDYQAELKFRGVTCADGWKRLPERADVVGKKVSKSYAALGRGKGWTHTTRRSRTKPYQVMVGKKYVGVFATQEEAEAAYSAEVAKRILQLTTD